MPRTAPDQSFGKAHITPADDVVAGSFGTWKITYEVGEKGIQIGGYIRIQTDSDTDWGTPQVLDPGGDEYLTVHAPPDAGVGIQVKNQKVQQFVVTGRALRQGEEIVVTFGDRSGGGKGSRAQTFYEPRRCFHVEVSPDGNRELVQIPDSPEVAIVSSRVEHLVLVAPSEVTCDVEFSLFLRAEDAWGNPDAMYRGVVCLECEGVEVPGATVEFGDGDGGVRIVEGCLARIAATYRIQASDETHGLVAESNPIVARDETPQHTLYWGDPHGGQVTDAQKIEGFFRHARDVARVHFVGYQRNDHGMSNEDYAVQQRVEKAFYAPHTFVPLPGYEWSPPTDLGGHHNVYFRRFNRPARRSSHGSLEDTSGSEMNLHHITDVYQAYRGNDLIITPHVGGYHSDLTYHDPSLEPALEITSDHGSFEWFLEESLRRGYKMGFLGGSDSYTGRPGYDRPGYQERRYAKNGLTGLYAKSLTLTDVLDAMQARHCYATTGARIVVSSTVDGHAMGAEYKTSGNPEICASVEGTAPLERIELFRGLERIHEHDLSSGRLANRVRITWQGASKESSYSGVIWDGRANVSGSGIQRIDKFRFDSPRSHLIEVGADGFGWHSWTCGYRSGVVVELDPTSTIEIAVHSSNLASVQFGGESKRAQNIAVSSQDRIQMTVKVSDLVDGPRTIELGPVNRKITVELEPELLSRHAEFTYTDDSPRPGVNPYWFRVLQADGEMAWTSPVFADYIVEPLAS